MIGNMYMTISLILSNMRKCIYILLGFMLLFASCEKGAATLQEGQPIYLSVSLPDNYPTRIPFQGTAPTTTNPLNVDVWASTTEKVFKDEGKDGRTNSDKIVSIHTSGHFQSGEPQLLSQAVYPPPRQGEEGNYTADPVYFVAMHPQSAGNKKWGTEDGKQAVYTFSGCEDVMFAPQVSGAYDTKEQGNVVTNSPTLNFKHLLTRFTVKIGIELETGENLSDVQDAWGNITDLKIQSYNTAGYGENLNKVTIDLSEGDSFSYDSDVSFSGEQGASMTFYNIGTDTPFALLEKEKLTQQADSVAYVMCAPVTATDSFQEYIITVGTEKRGEQEIIVDLKKSASEKFTGSTMGKHFGITLSFKKGSAIATMAVVEDWVNGGFGSGDIED